MCSASRCHDLRQSTPTSFTRPTVVLLLQGVLYLILALGLSGYVDTGSSEAPVTMANRPKLRRGSTSSYLESICQVSS